MPIGIIPLGSVSNLCACGVDQVQTPLSRGFRFRRSGQLRRPLLLDDAAASVAHERVVSVDLAGESRPATREVFQNLGFSFALR